VSKEVSSTFKIKNLSPSVKAPDVELSNMSFAFAGMELFSSLDFKIHGGQWTCLLGPSGCGKSTLLRLISGSFSEGVSGTIRFNGITETKGQTAWMAQKDLLLPWLTVQNNVLLGARLRGEVTEQKIKTANLLLDAVGLKDCANDLPATLSGGMRQRVALLRTLMEAKSVILMDEPFSALDALTRIKLQDLAVELVQNATVLLVTHDPLEALRLGHRIHVMTGRPARLSRAILPPGSPPRNLDNSSMAAMHATLLEQLVGNK
jgi:putative hydroxymethylpyrimidine transport system ATP-binding protein